MAQESQFYANFTSSGNNGSLHGFDVDQEGNEEFDMQQQNQNPSTMWRPAPSAPSGFFRPPELAGASSHDVMGFIVAPPDYNQWDQHHHHHHHPQVRLMLDNDSSSHLGRCLFPPLPATAIAGVGEPQPDRSGLSLSLCNPVNVAAGLPPQPFHVSPMNIYDHQTHHHHPMQHLKNSKYLIPAQELLNEFCNLWDPIDEEQKHKKPDKRSQWDEGDPSSSSSSNLSFLDILELQKRKAKLITMLEEVDRRYRRYCEQMRAVVGSLEAAAGEGAAAGYSRLAQKAMSRHFRCLRDGIAGQIRAAKKVIGEKDPVAPGTTKGETPRLKLLDQCLRQQKAAAAGILDAHPWRPQRGLPERSVSILRAWLFEHFLHPYPSDVDKHILARQTGLSRSQVSNWFINARVRLWKPMVEEMYMEEIKEQENQQSSNPSAELEDTSVLNSNPNPRRDNNDHPTSSMRILHMEDEKPNSSGLILLNNDSESLSSIINNPHQIRIHSYPNLKMNPTHDHHNLAGADHLEFAGYGGGECSNHNFGGGVSLTLGLQQHNGGGMSLSFSPEASQHSIFFNCAASGRENLDVDCQPVQLTVLDGDAQNLPYRNLMGAQLLHDLAG